VLTKAGDVLAVLAEHGPLGAAEIAERVGEPRSSVYRFLRTLRQLEYVESSRRGRFELGMRLFELGASVASRFSIRQAAREPMDHIYEETEGTVLLFVRRGDAAVCVERVDGRWVRLEIVDVGETLPLHTGASPRVLLAFAEPKEIDEYLDRARLDQHTERSPSTPRDVRALLEEIRATGFAISDQDLVPGVASIGAPIRDHEGRVVAAVSYSGLTATLLGSERERSIQLAVDAAREASRRLGWQPDPDGSVAAAPA